MCYYGGYRVIFIQFPPELLLITVLFQQWLQGDSYNELLMNKLIMKYIPSHYQNRYFNSGGISKVVEKRFLY